MASTVQRVVSVLATSVVVGCVALTGVNSPARITLDDKSDEANAPRSASTIETRTIGTRLASSGSPDVASRLSGLPWASGVFMPDMEPAQYAEFGKWRGRKNDVAVLWSARETWKDIVNPSWLYARWRNQPGTKVMGVAPIPEGVASASLASCAAGAYDKYWRMFGQKIKAHGMDDDTVIRLGWEFNGNWYKWSASNPKAFAACWRHIVTSAERYAPALRWDWTVVRGPGQSVTDARAAYPGDAYVDFVGVDSYDMWPGVTNASAWNIHLNGAYGLKFWLKFAARHGKKLNVPEWGVYPGTAHAGHNGGDNAYYIAKMTGFFAQNARFIGYESYFNEPASYYAGSLHAPTQNPRAAKQYLKAYRR